MAVPGEPCPPDQARAVYCAVIGDIIGSRSLGDRRTLQARFLETVAGLSDLAGSLARPDGLPEPVSRFIVTAGDEFQGLLRTAAPVYEILLQAEASLGTRLRLGVGLGTLDTDIRPEAIGMDGPAFHRARSALQACKKSGASLLVHSERPERDAFVNTYLALTERLRRSFTDRQREVIQEVERQGTQAQAAVALGVSAAAVSQVLKAAGWSLFVEARANLRTYLSHQT